MSQPIVFFDIDGTLLDHKKQLPPKTKEAISQLQKNGVEVAIATGRAPFMFGKLREELNIHSYVSINGQVVVYQGKTIFKNPVAVHELERLEAFANEHNHPLVFINDQKMVANDPHHSFIAESIGSLQMTYPPYEPNYYKEEDIFQALLFCEKKEEQPYVETFQSFDFIRWHEFSTDVIPTGQSKAEGIKRLLERKNISMHNAIAFGDGLNDVNMLKTVGFGIAMGNGVKEAKEAADYVTCDVDQDGIYHALNQLKLI